uniref:Uncharacterized protein n=1 Tax=Triticum urartu TaxID=4572 RepID=A0A8R7QV37_TRIUA
MLAKQKFLHQRKKVVPPIRKLLEILKNLKLVAMTTMIVITSTEDHCHILAL